MLLANDNCSAIIIIREFSVIQIQSYCFLSDKTTFLSRIQINIVRHTQPVASFVCGLLEAGGEGEAGTAGTQHGGERQGGGIGTGGGFFACNAACRVAVKEADELVDRVNKKSHNIA